MYDENIISRIDT